jgi:hypothetical protein
MWIGIRTMLNLEMSSRRGQKGRAEVEDEELEEHDCLSKHFLALYIVGVISERYQRKILL